MIKLFLNRIYRSIKIDPAVFEEVQKDKNATIAAATVVVLSSLAAGVGASHLGKVNFFFCTWTFSNYLVCLGLYCLFCWGKAIS